jgi:hypothetical protein
MEIFASDALILYDPIAGLAVIPAWERMGYGGRSFPKPACL